MTCIIGYKFNGMIYMGADSAASDNNIIQHRSDKKIFYNAHNPELLIGIAGSYRFGQLLRYVLEPPHCDTWDIEKYMVTEIANKSKQMFANDGLKDVNLGEYIFAFKDRLWFMDTDFHIGWFDEPFATCGSGSQVAYGSMMTLERIDPNCEQHSPQEKVRLSLAAAEDFVPSVRGPFHIIEHVCSENNC